MLIIVPVLKKVAVKINLTDKPNSRKLHQEPVPLIGGIAIAISVSMIYLMSHFIFPVLREQLVVFFCAIILLIVGVIDDKFDLSAKFKLLIQLFCAFVIATSGTRITSLFGLFGVYEIPVISQYLLTIVVICGVVNAFNLMDGIDGLAGELSVIGFSFIAVFAYLINDWSLFVLCVTFLGAIFGFLNFNLRVKKIFMGDAGSLFIGTLLIGFSIHLLNHNLSLLSSTPSLLYTIIGFFALPVLDSLRVYLGRLKKGYSPFKADKTHIHHLFLVMNLPHKKVSIIISIITLGILMFSLIVNYYLSITVSLILVVLLFSSLGFILNQNRKVFEWKARLKDIEENA